MSVASTSSRMCAIMSSRVTDPSANPREKAKPAEVVAIALKPRCCRYFAVPGSHGFGRAKQPFWCNSQNISRRSAIVGIVRLSTLGSQLSTIASIERIDVTQHVAVGRRAKPEGLAFGSFVSRLGTATPCGAAITDDEYDITVVSPTSDERVPGMTFAHGASFCLSPSIVAATIAPIAR